MKKIIVFLYVLLTSNLLFAQSGLRVGGSFNFASSTLLNRTNAYNEAGLDFDFKFKSSIGGNINFLYSLNSHWSIIASAGYLQRGAIFANPETNYLPRYRFSYLDLSLGTAYHFQPDKKLAPFVSASVSQHNLLKASLKNGFEETDVKSNISNTDIGLLLAFGTNYKFSEKHALQFSIFYNQGFINVFNGMYSKNGLMAYNSIFGFGLGYTFDMNKKQNQ